MSIYLYCESCRSSSKRGEKICQKCLTPFGNNKRYRVVVRYEGQRLAGLFYNLAQAQQGETKLLKELKERIESAKQPEILTLGHVWAKYLPFAKENKKTWIDDLRYYRKHLEPRFGNMALDAITPLDLQSLISDLKNSVTDRGTPYAAQTIKHILVIVRRLYNLAAKWRLYDGPNPVKGVDMPHIDNQITEFLSPEELSRLNVVLDSWPCRESAAFIRLALLTGMRRGELFKLQWSNIDFDRGMLTLDSPKGGKTTTLPLNSQALEVLKRINRTSPYVFPGRNGEKRNNFKGPWERIREEANLPDSFRLHGLRHHFASTLVSNDTDLAIVRELLTHKDMAMTQRYAHLSDGALRQAAQKAGDLLSPKPALTVPRLPR